MIPKSSLSRSTALVATCAVNGKSVRIQAVAWLSIALGLTLGACGIAPGYAWQGIEYQTPFFGVNDVDILDWQYGEHGYVDEAQQRLPRARKSYVERGIPVNPGGMGGVFPVGDFLYVKWRDKATGEIHEEKADLHGRLPRDMNNRGLVWMIDQGRLNIYVFPPLEVKDVTGRATTTVGHAAIRKKGQAFGDVAYNAQHRVYP